MSYLPFCVLLVGCILCGRSSGTNAEVFQNLERSTLPSCGRLLVDLTSKCASTKHSVPSFCCAALYAWSTGYCWCEENAFNAASNLAMDYYAFQFRAEQCNLTSFIHPDIKFATAGKGLVKGTCPKFETVPETDGTEGCDESLSPQNLRLQRIQSISKLSGMEGPTTGRVQKWLDEMDSVFSSSISFCSIGLSCPLSANEVKDYLLSRSFPTEGALWYSNINYKTLFWRSSKMVSYVSSLKLGPFGFTRIEFVQFEICSPQIREVYVQESEAVGLFHQFVYIEPASRIFWHLQRTAHRWCFDIQHRCQGSLFPFNTRESCVSFYQSLWQEKRVTCTRGGPVLPMSALHGDTTACRGRYLDLALYDSKQFCPMLGKEGKGVCQRDKCPENGHDDIFREENPRYEYTRGYLCSSSGCREEWPYSSENNVDGLDGFENESSVVNIGDGDDSDDNEEND